MSNRFFNTQKGAPSRTKDIIAMTCGVMELSIFFVVHSVSVCTQNAVENGEMRRKVCGDDDNILFMGYLDGWMDC